MISMLRWHGTTIPPIHFVCLFFLPLSFQSEADVEKQFGESTGKKRNYTGYQKYRFIKQWVTGAEAVLEDEEIRHEIYTEMKKFMHASGLKKTPGHKPKETNIHLWKQYSKAYRNNRTRDWTRPF